MTHMQTASETAWLSGEWTAHLGTAIQAMTGQPGTALLMAPPDDQPDPEDGILWRQPLDAVPGAEIRVAVSASVWRQIGGLVLSSAGLEDLDPAEVRSTFLEVLQQSLAPLCAVLGGVLHREVGLHPGDVIDHWAEPADWQSVQIDVAGRLCGMVWMSCSTALREAIRVSAKVTTAQPERPERQKASRTMDLLMEVELPVGVSFGRAQMRLKDAIKLTTGSIVELNRSIAEPVEIVVNNCVIARGEVVVVEGNYGVRIRNIVSREERLRTLF